MISEKSSTKRDTSKHFLRSLCFLWWISHGTTQKELQKDTQNTSTK
jgi:hypothetical protein